MTSIERVRPEVRTFARLMEEVLAANDHKGGWGSCDPRWLFTKLCEEVGELGKAFTLEYMPEGRRHHDYPDTNGGVGMASNLIHECVDVANMAMMIADVVLKQHGSNLVDVVEREVPTYAADDLSFLSEVLTKLKTRSYHDRDEAEAMLQDQIDALKRRVLEE